MTRPTPGPDPEDFPITLEQYNALCDELDAQWVGFTASPVGRALMESFEIPEKETDAPS